MRRSEFGDKSVRESIDINRPENLNVSLVRHGQTAYGTVVRELLISLGQSPETFPQTPIIDPTIESYPQAIEGVITAKGELDLRETAQKLATQIINNREKVIMVVGPRTRHIQSANILKDELLNHGIEIANTSTHSGLVDVKGNGWLTYVDYAVKHGGQSEVNLVDFWDNMYRDPQLRADMEEKGYEHIGAVAERTEHVHEVVLRYCRRQLQDQPMRAICVTSDIFIEQLQQRGKELHQRTQPYVRTADGVNIKVWFDQNRRVEYEEISPLLE